MTHIQAVDLFCGAGGTSTGLLNAAEELGLDIELTAINHWDIAIATHTQNHPGARHLCVNVQDINPASIIPGKKVDLLVASPECIYFSRARGGKPVNDQQRVSPWLVLDWLEKLDVTRVLIENVPDLIAWGGVDGNTGKPIQKQKGKTFLAYLSALRSLGYKVSYRVINCANYGDATTRERLFIMARKDKRPHWPEPTHAKDAAPRLFETVKPWRTAREIIDWSIPGNSIYSREKPLSESTLRKIEAGIKRFGGKSFVLTNHGTDGYARGASVDEPVRTIAADGWMALIQPFVIGQQSGSIPRSVDQPLPTVASAGAISLVQPFVFAINHSNSDIRSYSVDEPMKTITSADAWGLAKPFLVEYHSGDNRVRDIDTPLPVQDTSNRFALAEPFLVQYNGTGTVQSVDDPVPTLTANDRFGLAEPVIFRGVDGKEYMLDVLFRMLLPHELAAAMSFPKDYKFTGTRKDIVRQIGNAVPRHTAKALCKAMLS